MRTLISLLFLIPMNISAEPLVVTFNPNGPECRHVHFYTPDMIPIEVSPPTMLDDLFEDGDEPDNLKDDIDPLVYQIKTALKSMGVKKTDDLPSIKSQIETMDFWYEKPKSRKGEMK